MLQKILFRRRVLTFSFFAVVIIAGLLGKSGLVSEAKRRLSVLAPGIAASKSVAFATGGDADADGKADPGDTLQYTVTINNTAAGATDATGVTLTDALQAQTALVGGSLTITPIAVDDAYDTVGNTQLQVASAQTINPAVFVSGNVKANDIDPKGGALTLTPISNGNTALGGKVTLSADGTFLYTPPAGSQNVQDSFTYTITNADNLTNVGTVRINIANYKVWYVKNNAASGNGTSGSPFNTLLAAQNAATTASGDTIYVFTGDGAATNQNAGITLDANQILTGEGAALTVPAAVNGGANPTVLRAAGAAPLISGTITLNGTTSANTLQGFNLGNGTAAATVSGTNFGTLTVTGIPVNSNGQALNLTTGTLAGTGFSSITSTGGTNNISLTGIAGTLTTGGALSGATGTAFNVSGGTAAITYSGAVSKTNATAGALISIGTHAAGNIILSGNLTCSSSCTGINVSGNMSGTIDFSGAAKDINTGASTPVNLTNNAGATINFSNGGLNLDATSGSGFTATGGGTVNVTTGTNANTIDTTTGTALNITTPTNIGASGVTFRSINVNNGASNSAANAIILNGTTGSFIVTGDGAATGGFLNRNGTGGTLNRTTGHSILLTNASNVTLRQMNITNTAFGPVGAGGCPDNCTSDAVRSSGGASIVLSAVTLQNLGGNGWRANNLTGGTNGINNNSRIDTWNTDTTNGVSVANLVGNSFNGTFTVDRCLFTTSATGADGFLFDTDAAGTGTVNVTNSEFTLIDQDAVQIDNDGSGTLTAIVQKNNFHDADATGTDGNNTLVLVLTGGGTLNFTIGGPNASDGNTFTNLARLSSNTGVLEVLAGGGAAGSATGAKLNGTIANNTLTNPAFVSQRRGIMFASESSAGNSGGHTVAITNNSVQNFFLHGIYASLASLNGSDNLNNNLTISNNQVGNISPVGQNGGDSGSAIEFETLFGADNSGGDISANALIQGNTAVSNNSSGIGDTLEITNRSGVTTGAGNSSMLNITALGNTLTQQNAGGQVFEFRNTTTPTTTACLDLNSDNIAANRNNATIAGAAGVGFKVTNDAGTFRIDGMGASTPSAFLGPRNLSAGASPATITASGAFTSSAGCTLPASPTFAPIFETGANKTVDGFDNSLSFLNQSYQSPSEMLANVQSLFKHSAVAETVSSKEIANAETTSKASEIVSDSEQIELQVTSYRAKISVFVSGTSNLLSQVAGKLDSMIMPTAFAQEKTGKRSTENSLAPAADTLTTPPFNLPAGKSVTVTFRATVNNGPFAAGVNSITNQATVSGTNFSNVLTNTTNTALDAAPDLSLTKSDGGVSTSAGGTVVYTLSYANNSAARAQDATGVILTETIPANTTFNQGASSAGWTCAPNNNAGSTCTLTVGAITAGTTGTRNFAVTVNSSLPAGTTQISNTATISDDAANGADLNSANNTGSDTTPVIASPTISKAFSPTSIVAGSNSTVTLTLTNGNATAALTNASITDTLVNMSAAGGTVGGTCPGTTPNALAAGATNLSFGGITIPAAGNCTVTFAVTSTTVGNNPNTTSGVSTAQTALVGTPSNTATLTVTAPPDLTITKTHTGNFTQGDTGKTYTITVTNSSVTPTNGTVTVTDTLPTGLTATAISGTGWSCTLGTLTCTRSDVLAASGSYPSITLTVNVANNAPASVTNSATVSGGGETNTANDTANDLTTINAAAIYTISGQVTNGGAGLEGVSVALSGTTSSTTITDASGNYAFANLTGGGNYTVTPSLNGYTFNPANTPVNNLNANQTAVNFATSTVAYEADAAPRTAGDGDGTVNGGDLTVIRRFVAGIETPTAPALGSEFQRVDCAPLYDGNNVMIKGDGSIDGGDITQVRRYAAGLDAVVPAGGPAAPIPPPMPINGLLNSFDSLSVAPNLVAATRDVRPVKMSLVGNILTVAVNLNTDPADTAASTVDFTLLYETTVLSNPTNIRLGNNAPAATTITPNTAQNGKVGIVLDLPVVGATTTFPTGDAQLVLIDFTVAAMPPATTTISFGNSPVAEFVGNINGNRLTTNFSSGSIALLAPTAATVTVGGRVMNESGRGINNVTVTLTDMQGQIRTARTNPFGYYRFYDVAAGETYILTAKGKRYEFSQPSKVLNVNEDTFDIDFIGYSVRSKTPFAFR